MIVGNACWAYAYFELLRSERRNNVCSIPPFALALNIAWETIYVIKFGRRFQLEAIMYGILLTFSILLTINYFTYGKYRFPAKAQKHFALISIAMFVAAFFIILAFYFQFRRQSAFLYSTFLRYALMSLLFVHSFYTRSDMSGQLRIAIAKCIGTLLLAVQYGYIEMINPFVLICAIVSFSADMWYIIVLVISKIHATSAQKNNY